MAYRRFLAACGFAAALASVSAGALGVPVGSCAPAGRIIPEVHSHTVSENGASPLVFASNVDAVRVHATYYRKADQSDALRVDCTTPCTLLIPKRYGFSITADVPAGLRLASDAVPFNWSQAWWCKGGLLCKTDLKPPDVFLKFEHERR